MKVVLEIVLTQVCMAGNGLNYREKQKVLPFKSCVPTFENRMTNCVWIHAVAGQKTVWQGIEDCSGHVATLTP
jgi:hypothetical protein